MSPTAPSVTFIGGGNMAASLVAGLIRAGIAPGNIEVVEPQPALRQQLHDTHQVAVAESIASARLAGSSWVLAVKPQVMPAVCAELATRLRPGQRVLSIAAGITVPTLRRWLGHDAVLVRAMPNTPALLGAGMTGLYADAAVGADDRAAAQQILAGSGLTRWIEDEALMDAVTAVSGSGPAYVFALAEAMEAAALAQGLDTDSARKLVVQTVLGAARMLSESGQSPSALRQAVTSPNGTTQAALEVFEQGGLTQLVGKAIDAATLRGRALAAG